MSLSHVIAVAAPSADALLAAVMWIVVIGLIAWLIWWLIDFCKLPDPFNKVAKVLVAVVFVVILIRLLLSLAGPLPSPFH